MRAFYVLWSGQFVSIFASQMTSFAITLWAWDLTGSATALALVGVASFVPRTLLSPIAGTLVDRWNRKLMMALSDGGAALATAFLLVMFYTDQAQVWHLYLAGLLVGSFGAFQYPATSSVITTMVPREDFSRANSLQSLIGSASGIGAPLLAGGLVALIGIRGILVIDLLTFFIALTTLLIIHIPQPEPTNEGQAGRGSVMQETLHGLRYILDRSSLVAIITLFMISNIASGFIFPMVNPMVLARSGNDAAILGVVRSAGSAGFVAGGLLMSAWKGPRRRIFGVNLGFILEGLLGAALLAFGRSLLPWMAGIFTIGVTSTVINSLYIAVLQAKVAPDLQGRIFGIEYLASSASYPVGQLAAGMLADNVLGPAMSSGGSLAPTLGPLFGAGEGGGLGLVIVFGGLLAIAVGLAGQLVRPIREIERLLPDHAQPGNA